MGTNSRYPSEKSGSPRFCIDFRKLSTVMQSDCWPLARVEEILSDMRSSTGFTNIDLIQDYWKVETDETCKEKGRSFVGIGNFSLK